MHGSPGKRKGQFFLLGALLLCALFFVALPAGTMIAGGMTADLERLSGNLGTEIPRALNLGMLEDGTTDGLAGFTGFVGDMSGGHYMEMQSLWVVTVPDQDDPGEVTVFAGNWMGGALEVSVGIDGNSQELSLDDGEAGSLPFSGVGDDFLLEVGFADRSWSGQLARDKTNLYDYVRLSRGEDVVIKEITG